MTDKPIGDRLRNIADICLSAIEVREMIATRAYGIYKQRGTETGDELSDWLRAEAEVVTMLLSESPEAETSKQNGQRPATTKMRSRMKAGNGTGPSVRRLQKRKTVPKSNPA
jgi:hypothetical protein